MDNRDKNWPAWYNGPDGASGIFSSAAEVPVGWTSGAEKRTATGAAHAQTEPARAAAVATSIAAVTGDVDAAGWPFDPAMHAATKSRTQANLWRMKVGVSRPAPKPGFPKPVLDL